MGLKVTATEAARLVGRAERTIRAWIAAGRLPAMPAGLRERGAYTGPSRWQIDVDDLRQVPGVVVNGALLAEMEARARLVAQGGEGVLARLTALEVEVAELRARVGALEQRTQRDIPTV